jgi:coniferyl-aldehyde dehydrogenase
MSTAAVHVPTESSSSPADLTGTLTRLREAGRKAGAPSYEDRIKSLEALERAVVKRKDDIARAISRDFGNRSRHESLVAEVFIVLGGIKHIKTHLREWMEPEERETSFVFLPAKIELRPQPLGVVGIISPWNYPV